MDIVKLTKELAFPDIAKLITIFSATLAPGFLIIYLFNPDLFKSIETVKLIITAAAIPLPVQMVNYVLFVILAKYVIEQELKEEFPQSTANTLTYCSLLFTSFVLYTAIIIIKFSSQNMTFEDMAEMIMSCEIIAGVILLSASFLTVFLKKKYSPDKPIL